MLGCFVSDRAAILGLGESGRPRGFGDERESVSARPVGQRRPGLCLRLLFRESAGAATGLSPGPTALFLARALLSCLPPGPGLCRVSSSFLASQRLFSAEPQARLRFLGGGAGCCLRLVLCRRNTCDLPTATGVPSAPRACALQVSLLSVSYSKML